MATQTITLTPQGQLTLPNTILQQWGLSQLFDQPIELEMEITRLGILLRPKSFNDLPPLTKELAAWSFPVADWEHHQC